MKTKIAFILLVLLTLAFMPWHGSFYAGHGILFCNSASNCRHEIGHMMDDDLGDISKTPEFGTAIATYLYAQSKYFELDQVTDVIQGTGGIFFYNPEYQLFGKRFGHYPQQELYANIYAAMQGDYATIPESLQPLYSQDAKYTDLYDCLMNAKVKLCGWALHIERGER